MERTASALRAQRLAELAEAIESAQSLAWRLGAQDRTSAEARKLYGRLEAARLELESIRSGDAGRMWTVEPELLCQLTWPDGMNPLPD
jgi:hypothetical protein